MTRYPASDEFIVWAQSLSGLLTTAATRYGTLSEMLEHPDWDESRTDYALRLVKSLRKHIKRIEEEMTAHVHGKY